MFQTRTTCTDVLHSAQMSRPLGRAGSRSTRSRGRAGWCDVRAGSTPTPTPLPVLGWSFVPLAVSAMLPCAYHPPTLDCPERFPGGQVTEPGPRPYCHIPPLPVLSPQSPFAASWGPCSAGLGPPCWPTMLIPSPSLAPLFPPPAQRWSWVSPSFLTTFQVPYCNQASL